MCNKPWCAWSTIKRVQRSTTKYTPVSKTKPKTKTVAVKKENIVISSPTPVPVKKNWYTEHKVGTHTVRVTG